MRRSDPLVIVCPLDWGLGHATRCVPVIYELLDLKAKVIIAADGFGASLLKEEFPDIQCIALRGYRVRFSDKLPLFLNLLFQLPKLIKAIITEHHRIKKIIREYQPDMVISDNRYGLWNKKVYSIFITHQVFPIPPRGFKWLAPLMRLISRYFITRYNECWVPDSASGDNLSGSLSHGNNIPKNIRYTGILSRFQKYAKESMTTETGSYNTDSGIDKTELLKNDFSIVSMVSGPEPQRTNFENLLISELKNHTHPCLLLRGITSSESPLFKKINNLYIADHLPGRELYQLLTAGSPGQRLVISRGGYSSLMDLSVTGNKVVSIPTPGQTEQQYLANKGSLSNQLLSFDQQNFTLEDCLKKADNISGIPRTPDLLHEIVVNSLNQITAA